MCKENTSVVNGIGFALLIVAGLLCALSDFSPFWIYYPTRYGVPKIVEKYDIVQPKYPFDLASWRGLWAVCFKEPDRHGFVSDDSSDVSLCSWFSEKEYSLWKSLPSTRDVYCVIPCPIADSLHTLLSLF